MLTLPTNVIQIQSKHSNRIRLRFASGCETSKRYLHITDGSQCDHFHNVHSHLWLSESHNNALTQIKLMLLTQKAFLLTYQSKQMSSYHDQSSAAKYKGLPQTSHKPVSKRSTTKACKKKIAQISPHKSNKIVVRGETDSATNQCSRWQTYTECGTQQQFTETQGTSSSHIRGSPE